MKTAVAGDDFYEDDEPIENVVEAFDAGPKAYTWRPGHGRTVADRWPSGANTTTYFQIWPFPS